MQPNFTSSKLLGLQWLYWSRRETDQMVGSVQWWFECLRNCQLDPGSATYQRRLQDASVELVALNHEIEYRLNGELLPSGD